MFKPLVFCVRGLSLSKVANICTCLILLTLSVVARIACDKIVNAGNSESRGQITGLRASLKVADFWRCASCSRCNIRRKLPLETDGSHEASNERCSAADCKPRHCVLFSVVLQTSCTEGERLSNILADSRLTQQHPQLHVSAHVNIRDKLC